MSEKVFVNHNNYPVRICLPSGAGLSLEPNDAVVGDCFTSAARAGVLLSLHAMPRNFTPKAIYNPMGLDYEAGFLRGVPTEVPVPAPPVAPVPTPVEEVKVEETLEVSKVPEPDEPPKNGPIERIYKGKTKSEWGDFILSADPMQVITEMKSSAFKEVGKMFGLEDLSGMKKTSMLRELKKAVEDERGGN